VDLEEALIDDIVAELQSRPIWFALAVFETPAQSNIGGVYYSGDIHDGIKILGSAYDYLTEYMEG
jgi:hypothetical protein